MHFFKATFFLSVFIAWCFETSAMATQANCGTNLLSQLQIKTLELASRKDGSLSVTIMHNPSELGKILVLISEHHFIELTSLPAALKLQQNFSVFGVEQSIPKNTWVKRYGLSHVTLIFALPEALVMAALTNRTFGPASRLKVESLKELSPERKIVDIEEDHQPSLSENICWVVALTEHSLSGFCAWSGALYLAHVLRPETGWLAVASGVAWIAAKGYWSTLRKLYPVVDALPKKRLGYLYWLVPGRDKTMALNLRKLSEANDGVSVGIFGQGHLAGVVEDLKKSGYIEVPLPRSDDSIREAFVNDLLAKVRKRKR